MAAQDAGVTSPARRTPTRPCTSEAAAAPAAPVPAWAVGVFHPASHFADAVNLMILEEGTFGWSISGCDFGADDHGTAQVTTHGELVLRPLPGRTTFDWMDPVGRLPVESVVLRPADGGGLLSESSLGELVWAPGGICPVCCRGWLGPCGLEPCGCGDGGP